MSRRDLDEGVLEKFRHLVQTPATEKILIKSTLEYAKRGEFTRYTSTLEEAWRVAIQGLNQSLLQTIDTCHTKVPELHVDLDYVHDPAAAFGIHEAKMHRSRGVTLSLFLALMKYYQQAYHDLISAEFFSPEEQDLLHLYVRRFFDRVEIGFASEWAESSQEKLLAELQDRNRQMTNEKNKYLTIFESLNVPVILFNSKHEIENANKKAVEYFEGSHSPGSNYYGKTLIAEKIDWLRSLLEDFLDSSHKEQVIEHEAETLKGCRTFEIKFRKMLDVSMKFSGTTVILNDITEMVEFDELRKQFVSTVSHELRTPISSIDLAIKLLETHFDSLTQEKRDRLIQNISRGSDTLVKMIEDLLVLSRVDSARITLLKEEVGLGDLLDEIAFEIDPKRQLREITINMDVVPGAVVPADRFRIAQVFRILLDNAIKYSPEHSIVQVEVTPGQFHGGDYARGGWWIKVIDHGIGIRERDIKNLFHRFFRSEDVQTMKGTGLGLAIAKEMVVLHGGTITVDSEYGKGSTFSVFLPA